MENLRKFWSSRLDKYRECFGVGALGGMLNASPLYIQSGASIMIMHMGRIEESERKEKR